MSVQSKLCCKKNEGERLELILQDLDGLSNLQKNILRERYIFVLHDFNRRCSYYSTLYHVGHFVITVGSLIVPALMSIQYADTGAGVIQNFQAVIYWITWVISLLVTTCNGVITLFKVDKKYFFLHTTCERLRSEGWQYFELTGRYSGQLVHYEVVPNHVNQFIFFTHAVEKIKMRQIEEEYYKQEETHANPQPKGSAATTSTPVPSPNGVSKQTVDEMLYTPSPERPIELISKAVPTTIKEAVNAIIQSNISTGNILKTKVDGEANEKNTQGALPV